jgi:malate synthase
MGYLDRSGLQVDDVLVRFVEAEALPGTGIAPQQLWAGLADVLARFVPVNRALLAKRDDLQQRIDGAVDGSAVVAIARAEGFLFSAASLARQLRA